MGGIESVLFNAIKHELELIEQTAKEFDVPYLCNESIGSAFLSHMRVISKLGKNETTFSAIANSMG